MLTSDKLKRYEHLAPTECVLFFARVGHATVKLLCRETLMIGCQRRRWCMCKHWRYFFNCFSSFTKSPGEMPHPPYPVRPTLWLRNLSASQQVCMPIPFPRPFLDNAKGAECKQDFFRRKSALFVFRRRHAPFLDFGHQLVLEGSGHGSFPGRVSRASCPTPPLT